MRSLNDFAKDHDDLGNPDRLMKVRARVKEALLRSMIEDKAAAVETLLGGQIAISELALVMRKGQRGQARDMIEDMIDLTLDLVEPAVNAPDIHERVAENKRKIEERFGRTKEFTYEDVIGLTRDPKDD